MTHDLFSAAGAPDWIHVTREHPVLGRTEEYRVRVIEHPVRHLEVEQRLPEGWAPIRWHQRVREIAQLAGVEP